MKTIEERAKECTRRRADVLIGTAIASIFEKGALYFKGNEVSLEDVNSLIRICKINLSLE